MREDPDRDSHHCYSKFLVYLEVSLEDKSQVELFARCDLLQEDNSRDMRIGERRLKFTERNFQQDLISKAGREFLACSTV